MLKINEEVYLITKEEYEALKDNIAKQKMLNTIYRLSKTIERLDAEIAELKKEKGSNI